MKSQKRFNTKKQSVNTQKKLTLKDILGIVIFSILCVSSFLFSIFFFLVSIITKNSQYLLSVFIYLIIAIGSFLFLFKFSNKDKNEQTTNSTGITFPGL